MLIFNSKIENPQHLEELLIGRKKIVNSLEKSVCQALHHNQNVNHLLIGTRGSGKTHVMHVLFNRFSNNVSISNKAIIAYMAEEEIGIDSFFSLLLRIFEAFIRWNNDDEKIDWKSKINKLKDLRPYEREERAKEFLLAFLGDKKLLLLIENINEVFNGMKKSGQSRFRDFIQQYDKVNIIATSQVLFADIQNEDKPFHNFFHITHLDRISEQETKELLIAFARTEGPIELESHFHTTRGIGQMRSIHFLSAGNHRLIALFYEFLKMDIKSDMADPFLKTLDKLKPYYESFIRYLPPQQQKIIHFLALKHQPQLGSVVAKECFLTPGGTSKQMNELQNKGFVEVHRIGRDSKYELAEPMLRFCIELTNNRDGIIGMLARFITIFYSDTEIINKYLRLKYLSPYNCTDGNLKRNQYDEILIYEKAGGENKNNILHLEKIIQSIDNESARSALVKITMMIRDKFTNCNFVTEGCQCNQIMNKEENKESIWKIFISELQKFSLFEEAFSLVSQVYKNPSNEKSENITIPVLFIRGLYKSTLDKKNIEEYILRLLKLQIDEFSKKLITVFLEYDIRKNKNAIYNLSKEEREILEQIRNFKSYFHFPPEMLDVRNEPITDVKEVLYKKLLNKYPHNSYVINDYANFLTEENNIKDAEKNYLKAIELNPKEAEFTDDYGLFLLFKKEKFKLAKKYFLKSLDLEPKTITYWFRYVDFLEDNEENIKEAEKTYELMIKSFPNSSKVFLQYSILNFYKQDFPTALELINKAIFLNTENDYAYYYRGRIFAEMGDLENAIENFTKSINIDSANFNVYFERGAIFLELNKLDKAQEDFRKIINSLTNKSIRDGLSTNKSIISLTILNLFLIGILTNKKTTISQAEKYLKATYVNPEVEWNYRILSILRDIIQHNTETQSVDEIIESLKKTFNPEIVSTSFDPLINLLKKEKLSNINQDDREYIIKLFVEIEKLKK